MRNDPNRAAAEGMPTRQEILYAYREWLDMEGRMLGIELFPELGDASDRYIPVGTLATSYHFSPSIGWQDAPKPSTRAELVLRLVGAIPTADELEARR